MKFIALFLTLFLPTHFADACEPVAAIVNPYNQYTLINSVDFHPKQNLFCLCLSQTNRINLYELDQNGKPSLLQSLSNPAASLSDPQHAAFSHDGQELVVANFKNQTIGIYLRQDDGLYSSRPVNVIAPSSRLANHKPHGITLSPCGKFLAIAYGAAKYYAHGLALYVKSDDASMSYELVDLLEEHPGVPKGITFTPDSKALLVTFVDPDSLAVYEVDTEANKIASSPKQLLHEEVSAIIRPEDVKITPDGRYVAISNSSGNTLTFYPFDAGSNAILQEAPCHTLHHPDLVFPHGIAFSPDGAFLVVTQFGPLTTTSQGDVVWEYATPAEQAQAKIFLLK